MARPGHVYNELWQVDFFTCIGWSEKRIVKYCKKNYGYDVRNIEASSGKCLELINDNGSVGYLIWTRKKSDRISLVHEMIHAALWALEARGVTIDGKNSEPLTYLVDWLHRKVT
jgi:hypothetical protein